ncbi:hypothetical protein [Ancylobacter rudongensis]|nr:hypothetical protein [Ancylobacter rudongensis]
MLDELFSSLRSPPQSGPVSLPSREFFGRGRIEKSPRACDALDVARMRRVFEDGPPRRKKRPSRRAHLLRHALGQGLRVGQFLARLEKRNDEH